MGVALENARLFDETQRLLKETEQRAAELAVINSIQEGMAAELDFQAIVDLVGDKLREVLKTDDIGIRWHDAEDQPGSLPVLRTSTASALTSQPSRAKPGGPFDQMVRDAPAGRHATVAGDGREVAMVNRAGDRPGSFADLRPDPRQRSRARLHPAWRTTSARTPSANPTCGCCSTVAASMGVALENARLFDETQRLLKETEQRAAELAVINSIQEGMAAELDFQAIVDLVGDKLREVFNTGDIGIRWHDREG